jgi:hypothetical protein
VRRDLAPSYRAMSRGTGRRTELGDSTISDTAERRAGQDQLEGMLHPVRPSLRGPLVRCYPPGLTRSLTDPKGKRLRRAYTLCRSTTVK